MFVEWGFLLAEIWVLLALAALVGLIAGWLIWGGRRDDLVGMDEITRMRSVLEARKPVSDPLEQSGFDDVPAMQGGGYVRPSQPASPLSQPRPIPEPVRETAPQPVAKPRPVPTPVPKPVIAAAPPEPKSDPKPVLPQKPAVDLVVEPPKSETGQKPSGLSEARDGLPDDLTKIKGIGRKLERMCNRLGFYHYDQIAAWTADEIAWVDDNLEGFKGRVTRDNWVEQARLFAKSDIPAFVRRRD